MNLFKIGKLKRALQVFLASFLILVMVLLSACGKDKNKQAEKQTASKGNISSNTETEDKETNDFNGNFESEFEIIPERDDADEIAPADNCAILMNPQKGSSDEIANDLRKKIKNSANTDSYYKLSGKVYYISPNGNDMNDGLSPQSPLRTIGMLGVLSLKPGDAILFERNSVFRLIQPINAVDGVIYGAYGKGAKPCIYASPKNYATPNIWTPSKKANVWKVDFTYGDVGSIIFNHGEDVGKKKSTGINQLKSNGQFFHNVDDGIVYLYFDKGNPSNFYKDIEIAPNYSIFNLESNVCNVTIDNLCLKYSAKMGVDCKRANKNINITNCELAYIGGARLGGALRYGNAIQFWNGTENSTVKNCWIYQIFDTAITFQGELGSKYKNISFNENLLEYNELNIEVWDHGKEPSCENFVLENNICRFSGQGWGTRLDDTGIRGLESDIMSDTNNFTFFSAVIRNNVFDSAKYSCVRWVLGKNSDINVYGNVFYGLSKRSTPTYIQFGVDKNKFFDPKSLSEFEMAVKSFDPSPKCVKWIEV